MKKNLLMWDETLFRDPEVFEIDYIPEQFNFRDTQMQSLVFQVRPGIRGGRPLNTICRGLPGTGKTTTIRKLFSEIENTTKKLVPVYINCQMDNTKFAIFSQIYRKLSGHLPPASGTSFKQILDSVARMVLDEDIVLLVCLDDANYLLYDKEINNVLYTLLRSHESYPGTRISVIAIVSDMQVDLSREVDARVYSVFRPTDIYFSPYTEDEVRNILHERILQGLYSGVVTEKMLDIVVEQTMKSGDLRVGIDLLKRAALNAENDARKCLNRDDICRAYEISKYLHLTFTVRTLKDEEKVLLKHLAEVALEEQEMTTGSVFKSAKKSMKIGYTRYYWMINKFDEMRLINLFYREGRGRSRLISLRYEPERVIELIE
ncbi:MAG: ORC1-type DNA replication protein [Methanogenium sp.]|nr:ORC1-type DNA replication protein [Methanogenium sp.]